MANNHLRRQIRDRVVSILVAGATGAGTRVHAARVYPIREDGSGRLPAICVHTRRERAELEEPDEGDRSYRRTLQLAIDLHVADADADDDLDALAAEVEAILEADNRLNGLAWDCVLEDTDIVLSGEGRKPIGFARLTYAVTYHVAADDPTAAR